MSNRINLTPIDPFDWPKGLVLSVKSLGDPLSVHRTPRWLTQIRLLGGGLFFLLAIILFRIVTQWNRPEYLIVAIPLLFTSLSLVYNGLKEWGLWVLVFPTGIMCWQHNRFAVFPWDEIWEIYISRVSQGVKFFGKANAKGEPQSAWLEFTKLPRILGPTMNVIRHDQARVRISSSLEGFDELSTQIQQNTFINAWNYCDLVLSSDYMIWFGYFKVSKKGIFYEDQQIFWNEIDDILIAGGYLQVRNNNQRKPLLSLPLDMIPNPHVLLALIALQGEIPCLSEVNKFNTISE